MAQLAVTAGGAVAGGVMGSFFPGVGTVLGAQIGAMAGAIIGGIFFPGGGPTAQGPVIGDLRVQAASYGKPQALLAGTIRVAGEIIAMSDLVATEVTQSVGGGLGGAAPTVSGYTYSITMAVSFGKPLLGPAKGITRIWADGKCIYNDHVRLSYLFRGTPLLGAVIRRHLGSATELPDPFIQKKFGAKVASAYRGQVYIVIENLQLADFANHPPNLTAEVVCNGDDAYPYQTVNPGGTTDWEQMLAVNSDLGVIAKLGIGGDIAIVDTQTLEVLLGPSVVTGQATSNPIFGPDGYIYAPQDGVVNFTRWAKIDPNSLEIVQSVGARSPAFDSAFNNLIPLTNPLKNRGYPYILGVQATWLFCSVVIVSTGYFEALSGGAPAGGDLPMRFVAKTSSGAGDPACQDWEIDAQSVEMNTTGLPGAQFDLWGVWGDPSSTTLKLFHFNVSDSFAPGGGEIPGGANGVNPITLLETIDISSARSVEGGASLSYMDDGEHALLISYGSKLLKFNLDSETVTGAELGIGGISPAALVQGPSDTMLYCGSGSTLYVVDTVNWEISETVDLSNYSGSVEYSNPQWDEKTGSLWLSNGTTLYAIQLDSVTSNGVVLGEVVQGLCELGGLTADELDVSELTDTLEGYAVSRQCSIKDAIAPLASAFMFEAYEADFKLKFAKLGTSANTIAATLSLDDVGAYPEHAQRPEPVTITDTNQRQLPRRVFVKYINPDPQYLDGAAAAQRHQAVVSTVSEMAIDVPVVMKDQDAVNLANAWLQKSWINGRKFEFATTAKFLKLTPTDNIIVTDQYGGIYQAAIKQIDAGADGTYKVTAVLEDPEAYVPAAPVEGGTAVGSSGGVGLPGAIGNTDSELMDIVLIQDAQSGEGFYLAMAPSSGDPDDWLGGVLMVSQDGGNSFSNFETLVNAANMGRAATALPAPPGGRWTTWDRVSSITVRLYNPELGLASASEINVLNGANLCVLGNELIAFATAVANEDGTFTLSDLLRGLRGSDPFIGTHAAGERFVMVDFTKWANIQNDPNFGLVRVYKTQSIGSETIPKMTQVFTDTGVRLKPLTAQGPTIATDEGNDLIISWNRQTRIGGTNDWADGIETVPLGEASESYEVDIIKDGEVVRTLTSTSPTVTYTSADQVADFGSNQTSVEIVIYQMSAVVGRGFGLEQELALAA